MPLRAKREKILIHPLKREIREILFIARRGNFKWTHVRCREDPRIPSSISFSFFLIVRVPVFGEKPFTIVILGFGPSFDVFPYCDTTFFSKFLLYEQQ